MAEISDLPQRRIPNRAFQRAQDSLVALRTMRHGGTASDVRDLVIDKTGERISLEAIKSALWHLVEIGLVQVDEINNSRWWKIKA